MKNVAEGSESVVGILLVPAKQLEVVDIGRGQRTAGGDGPTRPPVANKELLGVIGLNSKSAEGLKGNITAYAMAEEHAPRESHG